MKACKNLSNKKIENLSDTAQDQSFGDLLKVKDFLDIWMVGEPLQMTETVFCGHFQLYFYEKMFNANESSKTIRN